MATGERRVLAAVFVGGMAGALARVWIGLHFASGAGDWPWATFAINVSGTFALACLAAHLRERPAVSIYRLPLLGIGFCGAYTTFSTMSVETLRMIDRHGYGLAVGYSLASVAAGLSAIWAGGVLARRIPVIR
ncbi:MAG TPA: fluoride efflux transporter CrcB [Solirubrobacteraceae bacterium]